VRCIKAKGARRAIPPELGKKKCVRERVNPTKDFSFEDAQELDDEENKKKGGRVGRNHLK